MLRTSSDLLFCSAFACLAGLPAWLGWPWPFWQALLALPLVLFLPGYALTAALFPPRSLGIPERLLFSVGLSLVVTIIGSVALQWLQAGLTPATWATLLTALTLCASLVAWRRRRAIVPMQLKINMSSAQGAVLGLAALVAVAAVTLARVPSPADGLEGYTLLWILPPETAQAPGVRLGVSCMEFWPTDYRLSLTLDDRVIGEWPTINLRPGEQWEGFVSLPSQGPDLGKVEVRLYRLDNPEVVYRRVALWQGQTTNP